MSGSYSPRDFDDGEDEDLGQYKNFIELLYFSAEVGYNRYVRLK